MTQHDASTWEKAREQLVKQRQTLIEALSAGGDVGQMENHIDLLLKIQAAIDLLDTTDAEEDEDEEDE